MRSSKRWWRRCASWWPPVVDQADLVGLLRDGVDAKGGRWADLGAGEGAFTMALADLLGPGADITAVDRDAGALRRLTGEMGRRFPATRVDPVVADFRKTLPLAGPRQLIERVIDRVERIEGHHQPGADKGKPYRHRVNDESQCETWKHRSQAGSVYFGPKEVWMRERPRHEALKGNRHHSHNHGIEGGRYRSIHAGIQIAAQQRCGVGHQHHGEQEDQVDELDGPVDGTQVPEDRVVVHPHHADRDEAADLGHELRPLAQDLAEQLPRLHLADGELQDEECDVDSEPPAGKYLEPRSVHPPPPLPIWGEGRGEGRALPVGLRRRATSKKVGLGFRRRGRRVRG